VGNLLKSDAENLIMAKVFISYSRQHKDFVLKLSHALGESRREAWIDWKDIPVTAEWQREIFSNIEAADSFIFVISPESVASENCKKEIAHAAANNKRMVPIFHKPVPDDTIPEPLAKFQRIDFGDGDDFDSKMAVLIRALDVDLRWTEAHTRLLTRAKEWDRNAKERSSWISYQDVARAAAAALSEPAARNMVVELGGPQALTPREVVRMFEAAGVGEIVTESVTESALESQMNAASDPLQKSFAGLMLQCARGDAIDTTISRRLFPFQMTSVRD
jgi:hypothetical protein